METRYAVFAGRLRTDPVLSDHALLSEARRALFDARGSDHAQAVIRVGRRDEREPGGWRWT